MNILSISICYSSCIICNLTWNILSSFINRTICCCHFNKSVTRNFFWLSCKWSCYFFVVYWSCWRRDNVTFFILVLNNDSSIFSNNSWSVISCYSSTVDICNLHTHWCSFACEFFSWLECNGISCFIKSVSSFTINRNCSYRISVRIKKCQSTLIKSNWFWLTIFT